MRRAYICDACVAVCDAVLQGDFKPLGDKVEHRIASPQRSRFQKHCSFCRRPQHSAGKLLLSRKTDRTICAACVAVCNSILGGDNPTENVADKGKVRGFLGAFFGGAFFGGRFFAVLSGAAGAAGAVGASLQQRELRACLRQIGNESISWLYKAPAEAGAARLKSCPYPEFFETRIKSCPSPGFIETPVKSCPDPGFIESARIKACSDQGFIENTRIKFRPDSGLPQGGSPAFVQASHHPSLQKYGITNEGFASAGVGAATRRWWRFWRKMVATQALLVSPEALPPRASYGLAGDPGFAASPAEGVAL
jgi:hypothetical protein